MFVSNASKIVLIAQPVWNLCQQVIEGILPTVLRNVE